jgi:RimJ/RimL family protein N-acetyltransferase
MKIPKPLEFLELKGKYVRLIPLSLDHAQELADVANISRKTYQFTLVPSDAPSARKYIQNAIDLYEKGSALPFAIAEKSTERIVGTTRFLNMEYWEFPEGHALRRPGNIPHVVEIGASWLGEPYQRSGMNTDAKLCLLTHAFEEWKVLRVSLKTDSRNTRSRANIERIGAKFDGVVRAHMPSFDGAIRDTAFYSILLAEWPELKNRLESKLR